MEAKHNLASLLTRTEIFSTLDSELVSAIAKVAEFREYGVGSKIVRQGEEGEEFFIIAEGLVNVLVEDYALWAEQVVSTLGPGQSFGEAALLSSEKRSATVQAKQKTLCAVLSKPNFERVLKKVPSIAVILSRYLAKRLAMQCKLTGFRFFSSEELLYDPRTYRAFPESLLRRCEAIPIGIKGRTVTVALTRPNNLEIIKALQKEVPGLGIEPVGCTTEDYEAFLHRYRKKAGLDSQEPGQLDELSCTYQDGTAISKELREILRAMLEQSAEHIVIESHSSGDHPMTKKTGFLEPLLPPIPEPRCQRLRTELDELLGEEESVARSKTLTVHLGERSYVLTLTFLKGYEWNRYTLELEDTEADVPPLSALFPSQPTLNLIRACIDEPGQIIFLSGPRGSGLSTTLASILAAEGSKRDPRNALFFKDPPLVPNKASIVCELGESIDQLLDVASLQKPDLLAIDSLTPAQLEELLLHKMEQPTIIATYPGTDLLDLLAEVALRARGRAPSFHRVSLLLEQKLVRSVCLECRQPAKLTEEDVDRLKECGLDNRNGSYFTGAGCAKCAHTGVSGFIPIFEAIRCSRALLEALAGQRKNPKEREIALRKSIAWSYRSFSRLLISQGLIDPLEGLRMFRPD